MDLLTVIIRSDTRLRLEFSSAVGSTAFTGSGTITITSQDGLGLSPTIKQRIPVSSSPNSIELVLSNPLVDGGFYVVQLINIPGADATFATGIENIRPGVTFTRLNTEIDVPEIESALYNIDLVWTGEDYLESANGDLASISGMPNVHGALLRRLVSDGLPWDSDYGAKPRKFVDGPSPATPLLRGEILRQMLSDNRVRAATVRLDLEVDNPNEANYFVDVALIGSSNKSDVSIQVPKTDA